MTTTSPFSNNSMSLMFTLVCYCFKALELIPYGHPSKKSLKNWTRVEVVAVTDTLAYYPMQLITTVKKFGKTKTKNLSRITSSWDRPKWTDFLPKKQ